MLKEGQNWNLIIHSPPHFDSKARIQGGMEKRNYSQWRQVVWPENGYTMSGFYLQRDNFHSKALPRNHRLKSTRQRAAKRAHRSVWHLIRERNKDQKRREWLPGKNGGNRRRRKWEEGTRRRSREIVEKRQWRTPLLLLVGLWSCYVLITHTLPELPRLPFPSLRVSDTMRRGGRSWKNFSFALINWLGADNNPRSSVPKNIPILTGQVKQIVNNAVANAQALVNNLFLNRTL
jgi:hypothetical protein